MFLLLLYLLPLNFLLLTLSLFFSFTEFMLSSCSFQFACFPILYFFLILLLYISLFHLLCLIPHFLIFLIIILLIFVHRLFLILPIHSLFPYSICQPTPQSPTFYLLIISLLCLLNLLICISSITWVSFLFLVWHLYIHIVDSKWFWRWCITHRITGFLDFFHRLVFWRTRGFGNWVCFRPQVKVGEKTPTQLGPLERANFNHWTPLSDLHSYLIVWDQVNSAGDNQKLHNKNCDEAPTCVELG
jgi:hypothetical protein